MKFYIGVTFFLFNILFTAEAQLHIEFPYPGLVFQRDTSGSGEILVGGYSSSDSAKIQVRLLPYAPNTGKATDWNTCQTYVADSAQNFSKVIKATEGWYNLQVRAVDNSGITLRDTTLYKIGIGEVFLIAGQSNAQGQTDKLSQSTADPYERVVTFSAYDEVMETPFFKPEPLNSYLNIYPLGVTSWCWAELGDKIAKQLNVPVFFFNAAWGGTSSQDWINSIDSLGTTKINRGYISYGLYQRTLQFYKNILGFRAVLWHQGESDAYQNHFGSPDKRIDYYGNMRRIIEPSRKQAGGDLAWVISQATFIYDITDSVVIESQRKLAKDIPNVFPGPYTDTLRNARFDGVHFTNEFDKRGLSKLADVWNQALDDSFFESATPMLPDFSKTTFLQENEIVVPTGFVAEESKLNGRTVNFLTDSLGNYYISPILPCGKGYKQFKGQSGQESFNEVIKGLNSKALILEKSVKGQNTIANSRRSILLKTGFVADGSTTFTAEIGGCY